MTAKKTQEWNGCPVRFCMSHFGDKWSLLIIRDLMFKGRHHYNEFLVAVEGISTNILANRLADLEKNGLVSKRRDTEKHSKYFYTLTEKGIALIPMMLAMVAWSAKYDDQTEVPEEFLSRLQEPPEEFKSKILEEIRR